jgi:hypothetical protein
MIGGISKKLKMGRYLQYLSYQQSGHRTIANLYMGLLQVAGLKTEDRFGQLDAQLKDLDLAGPLAEFMA